MPPLVRQWIRVVVSFVNQSWLKTGITLSLIQLALPPPVQLAGAVHYAKPISRLSPWILSVWDQQPEETESGAGVPGTGRPDWVVIWWGMQTGDIITPSPGYIIVIQT